MGALEHVHTFAPHVHCQDRPAIVAVLMMEAASGDKDSHPWREVESAMFAAVTEAVHNKTFELVRLTPDPEGIEKMSAAEAEHNFATAVSFCRATTVGKNLPRNKFMQDLLQRLDVMCGEKLTEGMDNRGKNSLTTCMKLRR